MGTTTKKAGTGKSKARQDEFDEGLLWRAAPVLGAIMLLFVAASLISYNAADAVALGLAHE